MLKHALVLLATVLALVLGVSQPVVAGARAHNNKALAVNTTDGASVFKLALSIRRTADIELGPENVAFAYAKCESCQAVAVAFQVVVAVGPVATVDASNIAVAVNDQCRDCETLAAAYQFVVVTGGPVRFTREGWREVVSIRRELNALRWSSFPPSDVLDRVERLAARLHQAVTTELRSSKSGHLRANGSRLEARLGRNGKGSSSDGTQRLEARRHSRQQLTRRAQGTVPWAIRQPRTLLAFGQLTRRTGPPVRTIRF
jgi:hypothetical protein